MDISLPVSEGSAAGVFVGGASSRSVDGSKFSQTFAKEMSEQAVEPEQQTAGNTNAANDAEQAEQSDIDSANKPEATTQAGKLEKNSVPQDQSDTSTTNETTELAQKDQSAVNLQALKSSVEANTAVNGKEVPEEPASSSDIQTATGSNEHKSVARDSLADNATPANTEESPADSSAIMLATEANDKTRITGTEAKNAGPAVNPALTDTTTNSPMSRRYAVHNEIFNNLRTQTNGVPAADSGVHDNTLLSGKALQGSGKNLPANVKAEKPGKQLNSFLPAGTQDWKFTADSLITAVSDKAAKFEALSMQFDSQSAESFSLVNAGTGRSVLAPQAGLKSELAGPASAYTSLTSDFLAGSEEWCQDFGTKIEWLNNENITKAELSLHPAELGVLDITINTEDDRISINIVTHNEKSREMLESSLPRLTELLKSQGLALENSNISHNSSSDKQNAQPQQQANPFSLSAEEKVAAELGTVRSALIRHQGQIDHYV